MTLGIVLRGLNNLFFGDYLGFFLEFIPQLIFMVLLFGYMIALIFIKWNTDYTGNTENAPSIITILMNLALKNGSVDGKPVWTTVEDEEKANKIFFYISLLCIPIILLPKPIIQIIRNEKFKNFCKLNINLGEDENSELPYLNKDVLKKEDEIQPLLCEDDLQNSEIKFNTEKKAYYKKLMNQKPGKEESPSDIFVHQIIETIEFVLGCISNTASYLRLWALSLAHSQLSKVFFEKSLLGLAKNGNFILVIFGYFIFANITVSVLMGMDLLEAFLHTLRLHWVEFQNKFYYADGTEFCPFSFQLLLSNEK
jgi:V-type H+-transporting ATPase subunit a